MSKRHLLILLIILADLLNTLPRYLDFSPPYDCGRYLINYKIYTLGQALSFTLLILATLARERYDKIVDIVLTASFWLSVNDVMDELMFDPYNLGFNEVFFSIIIVSHAAYQYWQYKQGKKIDTA